MFEISKIKIERKDEKVMSLIGLEFNGYWPWKNNPKFDECVFQVHGTEFMRFSHLQKMFKPHDILVNLNPREEPREGEFMSLLFEKTNPPSKEQMKVICSLKGYLKTGESEIATEKKNWTE